MHLTQFRQVANGRIVERQLAMVAKLEDRDGCHGLGDGGPVVCRCVVDQLVCIASGFSKRKGLCGSLAAYEGEAAADDSMLLHHRFELRTEFVERRVRYGSLGVA